MQTPDGHEEKCFPPNLVTVTTAVKPFKAEKYDFFKEILLPLQLCLTNAIRSMYCLLCNSLVSSMVVLWHRAWISKKAMNPFEIKNSWLEAM